MKNTLQNILFGKGSFTNGLLALIIVGLIALGCTCTDKDGFKFGKDKNDTNSSSNDGDTDNLPEKKEVEKSDASKGEIPKDDEMTQIVRNTLLEFDKGIKSKDFTEFYNQASEPFQESISPRRMKTKFQKFIDGNADLSGVENLEPEFTSGPSIQKQGRIDVLEVKGEFPTKPKPSKFELKYIPEGKEWKLISIQVFTTIYKKR